MFVCMCRFHWIFYIDYHIVCKYSFVPSFPIVCPLFLLLALFYWVDCSVFYLNGESRQSCLVPDIKGKAFSFSSLSMMLTIGFSKMSFINLMKFLFISSLLRVFHREWILDFAKCFFVFWVIVWFPCFSLWWIIFIFKC